MKKLAETGTKYEHFNHVRLFRDDLEEIIFLFEQRHFEVSLSDTEYEFDSLDEVLEKRGPTPRALEIKARRDDGSIRSLSITVTSKTSLYFAAFGGDEERAVWYEVRDRLKQTSVLAHRILNPFAWGMVAFVLISVDGQFIVNSTQISAVPIWIHAITIGSGIVWLSSTAYWRTFSAVALRRRHEGGFFKRNATALIQMAMAASLGAFLSYVVQSVLKRQ